MLLLRHIFAFLGCWVSVGNIAHANFPESKDFKALRYCLSFSRKCEAVRSLEKTIDTLEKACSKLKQKHPVEKRVWDAFVSLHVGSMHNKALVAQLQGWSAFIWDNVVTQLSSKKPQQQWGHLLGCDQKGLIFSRTGENLKESLFLPYCAQNEELSLYSWPTSAPPQSIQHDFLIQNGSLITKAGFYILINPTEIGLALYLGSKSSLPFAPLRPGWIFPLADSGEKLPIPSQIHFLPIPDNYQDYPWPSSVEISNRLTECMEIEKDISSLSELPPLQKLPEALSLEQILEKFMGALFRLLKESKDPESVELSLTLPPPQNAMRLTVPSERQDRVATSQKRSKKQKQRPLTPHGQPTFLPPQNEEIKGGLFAHMEQFFEKNPILKDLRIKSFNTKGRQTVIHLKDANPLTFIRPHDGTKGPPTKTRFKILLDQEKRELAILVHKEPAQN